MFSPPKRNGLSLYTVTEVTKKKERKKRNGNYVMGWGSREAAANSMMAGNNFVIYKCIKSTHSTS